MSENIAAPLDIDLNTVDTSMPLIAEGSLANFNFKKTELKQTKTPGVDMLAIDLVTTTPTKAQDNADLGPGIHVFHNLVLAPSGKGTWEMVARNVGAVIQNAGIKLEGNGLTEQLAFLRQNHVALLQGQLIGGKVKVVPEGVDKTGKSYRAKNEISVFMKPVS
jgi:hypothetical protein